MISRKEKPAHRWRDARAERDPRRTRKSDSGVRASCTYAIASQRKTRDQKIEA